MSDLPSPRTPVSRMLAAGGVTAALLAWLNAGSPTARELAGAGTEGIVIWLVDHSGMLSAVCFTATLVMGLWHFHQLEAKIRLAYEHGLKQIGEQAIADRKGFALLEARERAHHEALAALRRELQDPARHAAIDAKHAADLFAAARALEARHLRAIEDAERSGATFIYPATPHP